MGIADKKIGQKDLGNLARRTIGRGIFGKFAQDFSKDAAHGLDGLTANIQSHSQQNIDDQTR